MFKTKRLALILGGLLIAAGAAFFLIQQFNKPTSTNLIPITVSENESVGEIASELESQGLIGSAWWFKILTQVLGRSRHIVAGEYYLPQDMHIINIINVLSGGLNPASDVTARLLEGWTIKEMDQYVMQQGFFGAHKFLEYAGDKAVVQELTANQAVLKDAWVAGNLEGYLFPDTYRINKQLGAKSLIKKMIENFTDKYTPALLSQTQAQGYSVHNIITMASVVEREAQAEVDKAMVADIFWRRIKVGMPLQADSTVNYATGKYSPAVSSQDLKVDSLYNTYKYKGLPPGPIGNPGISAITAALNPKPNKYWFFLTTPQGKVIYSETFTEHVKNKQRYLR